MNDAPPELKAPAAEPVWKRCLDFGRQDAGHYNDYVQLGLFQLLDSPPRRVLELGCAGGAFGAELMRRYPGASVVGIEAGQSAAQRAAARLERVVHCRLEDADFGALGFREGEFDTVVAADVLEHLVNPWDLLVRLRPYLAPGAQVVASIPNVRNLTVISPLLLGGRFDYDERGLLDITHLRFFTLDGMKRMFAETGYAFEREEPVILPELEGVYRNYGSGKPATLKLGRMTLSDVSPQELLELCAAQFLVRATCRPSASSRSSA